MNRHTMIHPAIEPRRKIQKRLELESGKISVYGRPKVARFLTAE